MQNNHAGGDSGARTFLYSGAMRILIIEDDRRIAENLYDYLESRGHQCDYAGSLEAARACLLHADFDCLVLDRSLPDGDGLSLARSLRAEGSGVPVLVLTAHDTLGDKLLGFDAGVDDYVVKPFALQEVEARLSALARRGGQRSDAGLWRVSALEYDAAAQEARYAGVALKLTPKPLQLLALLIQTPNRVFSRRELELAIWGHEQLSSDNLRSVLYALRRALSDAPAVEVVNVHGLGYKLVER